MVFYIDVAVVFVTNPFKKITQNTREGKKQVFNNVTSASAEVKSCPQCGAPKTKETNLVECAYCGYKFMAIDAVIKAKG